MRQQIVHTERPLAKRSTILGGTALTCFLCFGCANPGQPKPPSLRLPQIVKDLSVERAGSQILLHWTTPSRTTDDREIKGELTAEVCREIGEKALTPAARLAACAPVRRLAVASGASETTDTLPPALQTGPTGLLTYRVQLFNATGHSAGNSAGAFAASGSAPASIAALRVTASEQGAVLEWDAERNVASVAPSTVADIVDLKRIELFASGVAGSQTAIPEVGCPTHPSSHTSSRPAATHASGKGSTKHTVAPQSEAADVTHLRAPESTLGTRNGTAGSRTAGTVDASAAMCASYTYTAQRVRSVVIDGHSLELRSEPSSPVTVAMRDTFPPRVPTGLAAISGFTALAAGGPGTSPAAYIDLSWEPNDEIDLSGYRVYRQLARPDGSPQGPLARLTALPIPAPSYRDVAVRAGQGYIYSVTAVDATGNESAPSAKAFETVPRETVPPETGDSPH